MSKHPLFRRKSVSAIINEAEKDHASHDTGLRRSLNVRDLTFFGIAAVIGTGVFTAIGSASANGGPGVVLLFAFTAVACGFAAYCYAEFASMVPISGSAYTYAYVAFGELFAWIIGWDLLMEYAIGNIAVAISWSDYFTRILHGFGVAFPEWLSMDFFTAQNAFTSVTEELSKGTLLADIDARLREGYLAWMGAPQLGGLRVIMDLPALAIVFVITYIVYIGIKESRTANNIFVYVKLGIILLVIIAGAFYVNPGNWSPFAPNGLAGIMSGVSAVFFAYIGFDALSTVAEECENPQKDLPRSMFNTLIICTSLYIVLVLVLTGMMSYTKLNVADPLAYIFSEQHSVVTDWIAGIISISAVIVIASVLLVYQMGQPRIWMSMSRDGLLPKAFSRIHPKYKTPGFATIVTGFFVAIPALFLNLNIVISLTSIGTLFAFILVCGGILALQNSKDKPESRFKTPFIGGKYLVPALFCAGWILLYIFNPEGMKNFFSLTDPGNSNATHLDVFTENIPLWSFIVVSIIITVLSYLRNYSLIPVLGLISCFYLMTGESVTNWMGFSVWLLVGLVIYFFYSYSNSKLGRNS